MNIIPSLFALCLASQVLAFTPPYVIRDVEDARDIQSITDNDRALASEITSVESAAGKLASDQTWTGANIFSGVSNFSGGILGAGDITVNSTITAAAFKITCPSGFTSIEIAGRQLNCTQTAEEGTGTCYVAINTCFTKYGGRPPTYAEWYIAMNNFTMTDETDDQEWVAGNVQSSSSCMCAGPSITTIENVAAGNTKAFRCVIAR